MAKPKTFPFFSIIMPVFNKEPHISRSINSILNQTFADFELIIVCDPSTDNSHAEVAKFTDPRICVFHRNEPGPGGYAARNLGIKEARAEWIAFLDADDEWYEEHLQRYYQIIKKHPDVKFLCSAYKIQDDRESLTNDSYYSSLRIKENQHIDFLKYLKLTTQGYRPAWTSIVCIKNTENSKDLFPAGKAKRGGDQFAWVHYLAREKNMIWSTHFGAIYHTNSVNMVTKSAPSNPELLFYEYRLVRKNLSDSEKKYLKKYINRRLAGSYFRTKIENNTKTCNLHQKLFIKNDEIFFILNVILSIFPPSVYFFLKKLKKPL